MHSHFQKCITSVIDKIQSAMCSAEYVLRKHHKKQKSNLTMRWVFLDSHAFNNIHTGVTWSIQREDVWRNSTVWYNCYIVQMIINGEFWRCPFNIYRWRENHAGRGLRLYQRFLRPRISLSCQFLSRYVWVTLYLSEIIRSFNVTLKALNKIWLIIYLPFILDNTLTMNEYTNCIIMLRNWTWWWMTYKEHFIRNVKSTCVNLPPL